MSTSTNRERVPTMWVQGSPQLFQPTQRVQTHSHTHTLTHSHTHTHTHTHTLTRCGVNVPGQNRTTPTFFIF
jgi:hypothetical protein